MPNQSGDARCTILIVHINETIHPNRLVELASFKLIRVQDVIRSVIFLPSQYRASHLSPRITSWTGDGLSIDITKVRFGTSEWYNILLWGKIYHRQRDTIAMEVSLGSTCKCEEGNPSCPRKFRYHRLTSLPCACTVHPALLIT